MEVASKRLSLNIKYGIAIIYSQSNDKHYIYFMVTNSISVHRNTILYHVLS